MQTVAFLGLGVMGSGMAARLVDAGFPVIAWNRSAARAEPLQRKGATIAPSPAAAAAGADVIISMVADDRASREVWLGANGALAAARPGTIAIESSTVTPGWIGELAREVAGRRGALLDAPVLGSRPQAAEGQMVFLVGGDASAIERARPILEPMSRAIVHLGPTGSGARMKLVNNFMAGVQAANLAEAIAMVEASGLDRDAAFSVLANGAPGSPLVKTVGPRMLARNYDVNFMLSLMRKDLAYAIEEAAAHGVTLSTAAAASALYDKAIATGHAAADFAAVVEPLRGAATRSDGPGKPPAAER
jgi:3-hydroxyisobutyrate dehydrogenase